MASRAITARRKLKSLERKRRARISRVLRRKRAGPPPPPFSFRRFAESLDEPTYLAATNWRASKTGFCPCSPSWNITIVTAKLAFNG